MRILKRNISEKIGVKDIEYISKNNFYVKVRDYGQKLLLKELLVSPGTRTWIWISLDSGAEIDIFHMKVYSFDDAINGAVNDLFCTVYEFDNFEEMGGKWNKIKYNDEIKTVYKSEVVNISIKERKEI